MNSYKYDAFISYRHINHDKTIAQKLQKLLETYKPPKNIPYINTNQIKRVFRDESELPTSGDLGTDIKHALEESRYLIVVCSEETSKSKWCIQEIEYFKSLHNGNNDNILTLLVSGEPSLVFPKELCYEIKPLINSDGSETLQTIEVEPLAANVVASNTKESLSKLNTEFLRIAAPILGCTYDELYQRHNKRRKQIMLTSGISLSILLLTFIFGITTIFQQRALAKQEQNLRLLNIADNILDDGNKVLASKLVYDAINKTNNLSDYFILESERLLSLSTYVPRFSPYTVLYHEEAINAVTYSNDNNYVFIGTNDGMVVKWDLTNGQRIFEYQNEEAIGGIYIEDNIMYVFTKNKTLVEWDLNSNKIIDKFSYKINLTDNDYEYKIKDIYKLNDIIYIVQELFESNIIEIDLNTKTSKYRYGDGITYPYLFIDKDLKIFVKAQYNINYDIEDIETSMQQGYATTEEIAVDKFIYNDKKGELVAAVSVLDSNDFYISTYLPTGETGRFIYITYDENKPYYVSYTVAATISLNGDLIALGDWYGNVLIIDLNNQANTKYYKDESLKIDNLKFVDDNNLLITSSQTDSKGILFNLSTSLDNILPNSDDSITGIYLNTNNKNFLTISNIGKTIVYSLEDSYLENSDKYNTELYGTDTTVSGISNDSNDNESVAITSDNKFKLIHKLTTTKPEYTANQGNGDYSSYWLVDTSSNKELFNVNIPVDFINIAIKDNKTGTILLNSGYLITFDMKSGKILDKVKTELNMSRADIVKFNVNYKTKKVCISNSYHTFMGAESKGYLLSLETGKTLLEFSDFYNYYFLAHSNDASMVFRYYDENEELTKIKFPTYQELIKYAKAQIKGRTITDDDRSIYNINN